MTIYEISGEYVKILEMLEDGDIEPEEVEALMDELNKDLKNKFDGYMRVYHQLQSESEAIDKEIKRLTALKKTINNNCERIKSTIKNAMMATDTPKIKTELFSASLKSTPGKMVIDIIEDVPKQFWKQADPEIDDSGLKSYVKEHPNCEFAHIEKGKALIIK